MFFFFNLFIELFYAYYLFNVIIIVIKPVLHVFLTVHKGSHY